jgi:hypothetical protein
MWGSFEQMFSEDNFKIRHMRFGLLAELQNKFSCLRNHSSLSFFSLFFHLTRSSLLVTENIIFGSKLAQDDDNDDDDKKQELEPFPEEEKLLYLVSTVTNKRGDVDYEDISN